LSVEQHGSKVIPRLTLFAVDAKSRRLHIGGNPALVAILPVAQSEGEQNDARTSTPSAMVATVHISLLAWGHFFLGVFIILCPISWFIFVMGHST
jgi:hypothetical protein